MNVVISRKALRRGVGAYYGSARLAIVLPITLTVISAGLWAGSLPAIDLDRMDGTGLISVLPPQALGALALFCCAFISGVFHPKMPAWLLLLQLGTWILMLHGINSLISAEPVFAVAWRHAGITDYILRTEGLDPNIDAYFSWPGFFALSALVTDLAALTSPVNLIRWAPPFFNLIYLAPLALILKAAATDTRMVWLGLWFFFTTNWISQDYFSPQAFGYFVYLLVLGILFKWFVSPEGRSLLVRLRGFRRGRPSPAPPLPGPPLELAVAPEDRPQRLLGAVVLITVFMAVVPSHQLTPFAILAGVAGLAAARQITLRSLPVLMAVLIGGWMSYMTATFLAGHLDLAFSPLAPTESAAVNVQGRLKGSSDHLTVVYFRLGLSALVWGLAALGAIRARHKVRSFPLFVVLAAAPFPLMILQPYGGEMLLRVYLLILPFCVVFMAALFVPDSSKHRVSRARVGLTALASVVLLFGFVVARYGNQTIDRFSSAEVEAVDELYKLAPRGSLLLAVDGNIPWKHRNYEAYEYKTFEEHNLPFSSREELALAVAEILEPKARTGAYLIITKGQKETVSLLGIPPPTQSSEFDFVDRRMWPAYLEQALLHSPRFRTVFANEDARIFALRDER